MPNLKNFTNAMLLAIGGALICLAIFVSNAGYANFLLGENAKDLSWGTMLFRGLLFFHGFVLITVRLFWQRKKAADIIKKTAAIENIKVSRTVWTTLLILSFIALGLRLWNLNADLWVDEVYTLLEFARPSFGEITTSFPSQNQHLLYSILAHASIETFGESAAALRLPSVMFGVASIWAVFFLCRQFLDPRIGVLTAALMTVSYHHIWFSQNARGYMGLLVFTLLATWLWFEALTENDWFRWFGYAAAIVFGMWIHLTMAFVVAAHALVYSALWLLPKLSGDSGKFSPERRAGIKPLVAWILSVTVTLQLYALSLPEFLRVGLHEESKDSEWTNPLWVLTETLQNLSIGFAGIGIVLIGAAFVAFGWLSIFRKNRRAAVLMILPPLFAGALMLSLGHNLFPRFFFFAMGFGLIIVVCGAVELPALLPDFSEVFDRDSYANLSARIQNLDSKIKSSIGDALVLGIILISLTTVPRNYALPKQDFSGAKTFIEINRSPDDEIVAVRIAGEMYGRYFAPGWSNVKTIAELETIERNRRRQIWLVYTLSPEIRAFRPELWQLIERDYETVKIFPGTLNGGEIFVCQRRNTTAAKGFR